MNKIQKFTDLIAWQKGHELVLRVYLLTKQFPDIEKFGLLVQMRRSASSITANLAEGFGRRGLADKIRFYDIAIGSLYELQDQLLIAKDLKYFNLKEYSISFDLSEDIQRLINALIRSIKK